MGVEHGGSPSQDGKLHRNTVDHVDGAKVRHTPVPETASARSPEGDGAVPVTVVSRAELDDECCFRLADYGAGVYEQKENIGADR